MLALARTEVRPVQRAEVHALRVPLRAGGVVTERQLEDAGFPDGFDAVEAAPKSHQVIFENAFVRVLEVSVSPNTTAPMHHHHWPSLLVSWDTGGRSPHVRYHRADGTVKDIPSTEVPIHPGTWAVNWMKPEPMHSVEILDAPVANRDLRIEIKCLP